MPWSDLLLNQPDDLAHLLGDIPVAPPLVGAEALGAVLDAILGVSEIAAALVAQGVEGAVAENAGEGLGVGILMSGEVLAGFVLKKIVCHWITSF